MESKINRHRHNHVSPIFSSLVLITVGLSIFSAMATVAVSMATIMNAHADVREGIMEDSHVNMTTVTHLSPVYQTSALSETSPAMSPLVGLPASMLTPEEIKIRMLAHEILSLLEEEVLDGPTVLDEIDGMSDDADSDMEMDVQDTVVEVEP